MTALALSRDSKFVGVGHAQGHIALYDLAKPSSPARQVTPTTAQAVASGRREGHLLGSKIIKLSFLGARHTAIVSADNKGLSFFHSLGKIFGISSDDTLRIFGRYPDHAAGEEADDRQTTILDMAPLPLGDEPHISDGYMFTAVAVPNKVVLCGIKPTARTWWRKKGSGTQHKQHASRQATLENIVDGVPEEIAETHAATEAVAFAALAWRPASFDGNNTPTLALAIGREVSLLEIRSISRQVAGKPPREDVKLQESTVYEHDEAVLAIRWLTKDLLVLVTKSAFSIFDTVAWAVADEQTEPAPLQVLRVHRWLPTTVMSSGTSEGYQRTGKFLSSSISVAAGKTFLLVSRYCADEDVDSSDNLCCSQGPRSLRLGSLLSWADHILALVVAGDFLSAIVLGTGYYLGTTGGLAFGLSREASQRQTVVGARLRELMRASANYAFSPDRFADMTHVSSDGRGVDRTAFFESIATVCAETSLALEDTTYLFSELYDLYAENGIEGMFVKQMEDLVIDGRMRRVPPEVIQKMVDYHTSRGESALAEQLVWHVDIDCLDLDQVLSICRAKGLFDALIYVVTHALNDFITPIVELESLMARVFENEAASSEEEEARLADCYKAFSYLSVTLLGRRYPNQEPIPDELANFAQSQLWEFLFRRSSDDLQTSERKRMQSSGIAEEMLARPFPILRLLLDFDAEALLDCFDIALEHEYLESEDLTVGRQHIIDCLIEMAAGASAELSIPIDIFVGRNVPKYPQFIRLVPSATRDILTRLATRGTEEDRDDRQLAVESLLSSEIAGGLKALLPLFEEAGFYQILQRAYRREGEWDRLAQMIVQDPDADELLFSELRGILHRVGRKRNMRDTITAALVENIANLVEIDVRQAASTLDAYDSTAHQGALDRLEERPAQQYSYLKCFFRNANEALDVSEPHLLVIDPAHLPAAALDKYINLMSVFEPSALLMNVEEDVAGLFDLDHIIAVAEHARIGDALLWGIDRQSGREAAMDKLDQVVAQESTALLQESAVEATATGVPCLRSALRFAVRLANEAPAEEVSQQWYRVLNALVRITHVSMRRIGEDSALDPIVRDLVEDCLASLIASESAQQVSFPSIFRRLVEGGGEAQFYKEVRSVIETMIGTYHLRTDEMAIANRLFDRDISTALHSLARARKRGWRPANGSATRCAGCRAPLFGKAAAWEARRAHGAGHSRAHNPRRSRSSSSVSVHGLQRRKSSAISLPSRPASPYLEGIPSPAIDKGKSPAREFYPVSANGSARGSSAGAVEGDRDDDGFFAQGYRLRGSAGAEQGSNADGPLDLFPPTPKPEDADGAYSPAAAPSVTPGGSPLLSRARASTGTGGSSSSFGAPLGSPLSPPPAGTSPRGFRQARSHSLVSARFAAGPGSPNAPRSGYGISLSRQPSASESATAHGNDVQGRGRGGFGESDEEDAGLVSPDGETWEGQQEEEEDEELLRHRLAIVVTRDGQAWHRLCAPRSLLEQRGGGPSNGKRMDVAAEM